MILTSKKYIFLIFSLIFIGCSNQAKWNDIEFYDVTHSIKGEKGKPAVNDNKEQKVIGDEGEQPRGMDIKVDMMFMDTDKDASALVCQNINRYLIQHILEQPVGTENDAAIEQFIADRKEEFDEDDISDTYYDHITGRAEYGREGIINYTITEDYYSGGAHPTTSTTLLRFSTIDGKMLGLEEIFADSCLNTLSDMLTKKLMTEQNVNTLEELHQLGFLDMIDMYVTDNFMLTQDSVIFYYNAYDIAPYAAGPSRLGFNYDELKGMIKYR